MNKGLIRQSQRIYDLLLKLYPKTYREQFGDEMKYVFSQSLKDAYIEKGEQGIFTFWTRTVIDAGKSLITQHLESQKGGEIMKTNTTVQSLFRAALGTAALLMIPFIGMQFSNEVNWTLSDFMVMGTMLFVTGLMLDQVMKRAGKYKIPAVIVIVFLFLWLWVELAVGLFTNWGS